MEAMAAKSLPEARTRLNKAKVGYKPELGTRLPKPQETNVEGNYVYFGVQNRDENGHHRKLRALAAGWCAVVEAKEESVAIKREHESVHRVGYDRLAYAPTPP